MKRAGWIYFARFDKDGPIKIGRGTDPRGRVNSLIVGSPVEIHLLGALRSKDMVEEEAALHEKLKTHRIRGEWFVAEAALVEMQRLRSRIVIPAEIKVKGVSFNIRLLRKEYGAWRKAAREAGMTLSAWIRINCNVRTRATVPETARSPLIKDKDPRP